MGCTASHCSPVSGGFQTWVSILTPCAGTTAVDPALPGERAPQAWVDGATLPAGPGPPRDLTHVRLFHSVSIKVVDHHKEKQKEDGGFASCKISDSRHNFDSFKYIDPFWQWQSCWDKPDPSSPRSRGSRLHPAPGHCTRPCVWGAAGTLAHLQPGAALGSRW